MFRATKGLLRDAYFAKWSLACSGIGAGLCAGQEAHDTEVTGLYVGEAPLLVVGSGEALFGEPGEGLVAELLDPGFGGRGLAGEKLQPLTGLFGDSGHTRSTASSSS